MPLWASHPRVYLDVVRESEAMCPYCGTRYRLKSDTHERNHGFGLGDSRQDRAPRSAESVAGPVALAPPTAWSRETPNLAADARGNTTLELITQWLRARR